MPYPCSHVFLFFLESMVALTKEKSTNNDSSKKPVCITESGASPNVPCIFPFRYNGIIHNSCIWEDAQYTEHKPWCSTLVDKAGHHVRRQSKWGNCGPDCPISPDNRNETTTVTGRTWFLSSLAPYKLLRNVFWWRERPLMTSDIRVGRGVQDSPQNGTLYNMTM